MKHLYQKYFTESKKLEYIAYRDISNSRYKFLKPYREYLILKLDSIEHKSGSMRCFDNVQYYTKQGVSQGKISNKMILIDVKNTCIDEHRDHWIFEKGFIEIK